MIGRVPNQQAKSASAVKGVRSNTPPIGFSTSMTRENEHINSSSEVIRTRKYTHNDRSIRGSDLAHKKMLIGITEERQSRNDVKTQSGGNKRKMTVIPSWPTNFSGLDRQQQKALLNITGGHQNSGKIKKNATFPAVRNTSSKNKKLNASRNN